jgi:SWI/SNF-related matrix-associated actin-dependent regulator 1 of chromatin subfamily A
MEEMGEAALEAMDGDDEDGKKKPSKGKKAITKAAGSSANILMELRKAASHPLLFRRLYNKNKVTTIAKACLNTPKWCDSNLDYVIEDLEVSLAEEILS